MASTADRHPRAGSLRRQRAPAPQAPSPPGAVSCARISSRLGSAASGTSLTTADMLNDRTLAASRSLRATGAAIRGAIFTRASICTLHVDPAACDARVAMATIHHLHGDADQYFGTPAVP